MSGITHEHSEAVVQAARWLADEHVPPHPIVQALKARFGLNALQATEAAAMASQFRVHRRADA